MPDTPTTDPLQADAPTESHTSTQDGVASVEPLAGQDTYLWDEHGDKIERESADPVDSAASSKDVANIEATPKNTAEEDKKLRADSLKLASEFGSIGLFLLIALCFSYYIGKWCDQIFGTKPIFTIFWICCGVAATILEAVKTIKKASHLGDSKDAKP